MTGEAPTRPDVSDRMRRGTRSRWLPTLAVLGVVVATTAGGFATAAVLSEPIGAPVSIPGVVSVQPLSGWATAEPGAIGRRPFVRLTRGSGTLVTVAWGAFAGDAEDLAVAVRDQMLGRSLERLSVSETLSAVSLDRDLEGQRFTFVGIDADSGAAVEGEVTTVAPPDGQAVVFVGLAPEGLLAFVDGDLHTMIASAAVGPVA